MRYLFSLLLILPSLVFAQDTNFLQEVVVTDDRMEVSVMESARSIQVIDRRELEELPVESIQEALQWIAGVDFRQRGAFGAQADVSMRGGTFDQTLILVNGVKMNDPQTGHHNMNLGIDLDLVERIEVVKGPAAARYGLNAFNGVINIITRPDEENNALVSLEAGSASNANYPDRPYNGYEAKASTSFGGDRVRHAISTTHTRSNGYRENTDLSRNAINYQTVAETNFGEFNVMASYLYNDFGANGFYASPIDSSSEERVDTYFGALTHSIRLGMVSLTSRVYSRKNFDTYTLFRERPEIFQNEHRTDVEGAESHASIFHGFGSLGIGIDYRREAINSSNLGLHLRNNVGLFIEDRVYLLNDRWAINAGLYYNYSDVFEAQFLPSIETSYRIMESLSIYGQAGQAFRVPTFTDLYYVGPTNVGNPDLQPERSTNYEVGLKYAFQNHFAQASGFLQQSSDLIDWVRASDTIPWQPLNYEAVETQGLEVLYQYRRPTNVNDAPFGLSRFSLGYTYLNMERLESNDDQSRYAFNQLNHQLVSNLTLAAGEHFTLTIGGRYVDRENYKSYWLVDGRAQWTMNRTKVWFDTSNLLDTSYEEIQNAPMPGRWYRLGLQVRLI